MNAITVFRESALDDAICSSTVFSTAPLSSSTPARILLLRSVWMPRDSSFASAVFPLRIEGITFSSLVFSKSFLSNSNSSNFARSAGESFKPARAFSTSLAISFTLDFMSCSLVFLLARFRSSSIIPSMSSRIPFWLALMSLRARAAANFCW